MSDNPKLAWVRGLSNPGAPSADAPVATAPINLYPKNLLQPANPSGAAAPAAAPVKPPPPPDGVLARKSDGRKYWKPAKADGGAPVAGKDWLEALLRFYGTGAPKPADPNGMNCSFNGATKTIAAVLDIVDAQATLGGYKPSRPTAGGIIQDLLKEAAENQALGDKIGADARGDGDVAPDLDKLDALPMTKLLGVLDRMQEAKTMERFADKITGSHERLFVAILTVRGLFEDIDWQSRVPKLNDDDRAAVFARAPAKIRKITPGPAKPGEPEEPMIEPEAVGAVSKDGLEVQVKLTAHSPLDHNLGETEFTVHIGADGKISQFELDVTASQQEITKKKGSVAYITATLSGNATIDMAKGGSKIAPDGVNAQIKAELAAELKGVPLLKGVTVKLTGTYGTSGGGGGDGGVGV
jgi:hypothetical protein